MLGEVKDEMDPTQRLARITGALYLAIFGFGLLAGQVQAALVVPGDAATTASNILDSEGLFRFSIIGWMIAYLADVAVAVALYVLLKPVSNTLALVAAAFRLVYAAIAGINLLNLFNAVFLLSGAGSLTGFTTDQANALALFFLDSFDTGVFVGLVFFAIHISVLGYLLFTSRYIPRIIGVLLILAGFGYVGVSLVNFLVPNFSDTVTALLFAPGIIGEFSLTLWLLVKGVKVQQTAPTVGS